MFFLTDLSCTVKRQGNLLSHLASQASHRLTWELCLCWKRSSADVQTSNMLPWLIQWDATLDPSKQRGSDIDDMLKSSLSRHTNCLLRRLSMCHLVNGSLVISQPSSMVPTKVVPHASPAISITDMIWVSTKQSVWTLRNLGRYSRIFTSVRKKIYKQPCTKNQKKYVIRDGFWRTCTNWKPQSNDISISSAIWQVLLVSDSLRDSACVRGAHRHKFKHQMCCPGWFNWMRLWTLGNREHLMDENMPHKLSASGSGFVIWSMAHLSSSPPPPPPPPAFSSGSNKGGASCKSCNVEHWPARQKQC